MDEIRQAFKERKRKIDYSVPDDPALTVALMMQDEEGFIAGWKSAIDWYKKQLVDPWPCAPKEQGTYSLCVDTDGMCRIEVYVQTTDTWKPVAKIYNVDSKRDGEVRIYNQETGEFCLKYRPRTVDEIYDDECFPTT